VITGDTAKGRILVAGNSRLYAVTTD